MASTISAASTAGRGQLRRAFIKVIDSAADWAIAARADLYAQRVVRLARFDDPLTYERFQITTDQVMGGRTQAEFFLKKYEHFSTGCFEGTIDYSDDNPASRGGFASFRTLPEEKEHNLAAYEALEMRVKTDGRPYILNVKSAQRTAQHLWQMRIVTAPHRWVTVALPFSELMLTHRGRVELNQEPLPREEINGLGILLADGRNGPFRFEVQYVHALAEFDRRAHVSPPQQMIEEHARREADAKTAQEMRQRGAGGAAGGSGAVDAADAQVIAAEAHRMRQLKDEIARVQASKEAALLK